MERPTLHAFLSTTVAAVMLSMPALAQIPTPEVAVVCDQFANSKLIRYGEHTSGCSIDNPFNTDTFEFVGVPGEQVQIRAASTTAGLDLRVRVIDPRGIVVDDRFRDGGAGTGGFTNTLILQRMVEVGGRWRFEVSDSGQDEIGDYVVQLERTTPAPGDSVPTLPWNFEFPDRLAQPTDVDFFKFAVAAGSSVTLTLSSLTPGLDPQFELIDPTGERFASFCAGGTGASATLCTTSSGFSGVQNGGTYYVRISDAGADDVGEYTLRLDCDSGCPTDPGLLALSVLQPFGRGSLRIRNAGGIPDGLFVTAFSALDANDTTPGFGWWGGLHINVLNLFSQAMAGPPFAGFLTQGGASDFLLPSGLPPLPTGMRLHWVTRTLSPTLDEITETSNIVSITVQ